MGFFDDISNKTALSSKINKLNASIKANYAELGLRYYNLYKDNPNPKFSELINQINEAYSDIKKAEADLAYLKGVVYCPNCKNECGIDLKFCTSCGTKLVKPESAEAMPSVEVPVPAPAEISTPKVDATEASVSVVSENTSTAVSNNEATVAQPEFKFCTECGNKVSFAAAFCTNCGKQL